MDMFKLAEEMYEAYGQSADWKNIRWKPTKSRLPVIRDYES
jgi:hypothetical protein